MATKRLKVADVERTLFDMACGAIGGQATLFDEYPTLPCIFRLDDFEKFTMAVMNRYFEHVNDHHRVRTLFSVMSLSRWTDYKTLAKAIVEVDAFIRKESAAKEKA